MTFLENIIDEVMVEAVNSNEIYRTIQDNIKNSEVGEEEGGAATKIWLAGVLASRGSSMGKINSLLFALRQGTLDPETKQYRDAIRLDVTMKTLKQFGLTGQDDRGRYTFSTAPESLRTLSSLRGGLSQVFNQKKTAGDLATTLKSNQEEITSEWMSKLEPEKKKMAEFFSQMSKEAYSLLRQIWSQKGAKSVAEKRARLASAKFSDSVALTALEDMGFIDGNGIINQPQMKKFVSFIVDPDANGGRSQYTRLMALNPELAYLIKRMTADQALARNAAGKPDANDPELEDKPQTSDEISGGAEDAIYSRIRDIDGGTKSTNKNQRATDRKRNFSDFISKSFQ